MWFLDSCFVYNCNTWGCTGPNKGDQADVPGLLVTVHDAVRSPAAPAALALLGGALASADGVVVAVIDTSAEAEAVARDEGVEAEGLGREDDRRR